MRKINKQAPLPNFNGNNYNGDCLNWTEFHEKHQDRYEETRFKILVEEQNQLCGYTEIYINEFEECHIDHYKKKGMFPCLTFDWNNLIVATKNNDFGANYKDNKSGIHLADYDEIFNPVGDNVENYFYYTTWGRSNTEKRNFY